MLFCPTFLFDVGSKRMPKPVPSVGISPVSSSDSLQLPAERLGPELSHALRIVCIEAQRDEARGRRSARSLTIHAAIVTDSATRRHRDLPPAPPPERCARRGAAKTILRQCSQVVMSDSGRGRPGLDTRVGGSAPTRYPAFPRAASAEEHRVTHPAFCHARSRHFGIDDMGHFATHVGAVPRTGPLRPSLKHF